MYFDFFLFLFRTMAAKSDSGVLELIVRRLLVIVCFVSLSYDLRGNLTPSESFRG